MGFWSFWRRPRVSLHVALLQDMAVVHPQMDDTQDCSRCQRPVGIYPSGLAIIRKFGRARVDLICARCELPPIGAALAPGAAMEPFQSVRNH